MLKKSNYIEPPQGGFLFYTTTNFFNGSFAKVVRFKIAILGTMTKREQLIFVGNKIVQMDGTEKEIDVYMEFFDSLVAHPQGCNLFYYPEDYKPGDDISNYHPTVESVVDQCMQYKA